jgi:hypothetical protein
MSSSLEPESELIWSCPSGRSANTKQKFSITKHKDSDAYSKLNASSSSSSSAFALAWRNYSPRSITPPRF